VAWVYVVGGSNALFHDHAQEELRHVECPIVEKSDDTTDEILVAYIMVVGAEFHDDFDMLGSTKNGHSTCPYSSCA
jgi:hypothetical protein